MSLQLCIYIGFRNFRLSNGDFNNKDINLQIYVTFQEKKLEDVGLMFHLAMYMADPVCILEIGD